MRRNFSQILQAMVVLLLPLLGGTQRSSAQTAAGPPRTGGPGIVAPGAAPPRATPQGAVIPGVAFVWSGGGAPTSNNCRYYRNMELAAGVFSEYRVFANVADGPSSLPSPPPNGVTCDNAYSASLTVVHTALTRGGPSVPPRLVRLEPPRAWRPYGPARAAAIRQSFAQGLRGLAPGAPVTLYVTDHGSTRDRRENSAITLWGEVLWVEQLRELLAQVPTTSRLTLIFDECFSGGMLEALWGRDGQVRPNACGIAAAGREEPAYSGGGSMVHLSAALRQKSGARFGDVYDLMEENLQVLSAPTSSLQVLARRYLERQAPQVREIPSLGEVARRCEAQQAEANTGAVHREITRSQLATARARVNELRDELQNIYRVARISESTPFAEIQRQHDQAMLRVEEIDRQVNEATALRSRALREFMKQNHRAEYDSLVQISAALGDLNRRLRTEQDPTQQANLRGQLAQKRAEHRAAQAAYNRLVEQAQSGGGSPDFRRFLTASESRFPENILRRPDELRGSMSEVHRSVRAFKTIIKKQTEIHALNQMVARRDERALSEYFSVLNCENSEIIPRSTT
jgi:hypothetical protein